MRRIGHRRRVVGERGVDRIGCCGSSASSACRRDGPRPTGGRSRARCRPRSRPPAAGCRRLISRAPGSCADRSAPACRRTGCSPRRRARRPRRPSGRARSECVAATEFVAGSMRETVPSRLFATQAAPLAERDPRRAVPDRDRLRRRFPSSGRCARRGSRSCWLAHSVPSPKASSVAAIGSGLRRLAAVRRRSS